jgi:hypothetical protein
MATKKPEEIQLDRLKNEPSNFEIISAFSKSDHLELFEVGNTARQTRYILASSKRNAAIIAKYCNYIESVKNATFYKVQIKIEPRSGLRQAIMSGIPGAVWIFQGHVITRDAVYYDRAPFNFGISQTKQGNP